MCWFLDKNGGIALIFEHDPFSYISSSNTNRKFLGTTHVIFGMVMFLFLSPWRWRGGGYSHKIGHVDPKALFHLPTYILSWGFVSYWNDFLSLCEIEA